MVEKGADDVIVVGIQAWKRMETERDRYLAVLHEIRSRLAYAEGIEVEASLRTIERVLDGQQPSV